MTSRTLLWTPRAKQRPRTAFKQGQYRTFTPRETAMAEKQLASQWVGPPADGPIALTLLMSDTDVQVTVENAFLPESLKLRKGDIDNYAKLIMDALNGVAWVDDKQIARLFVVKT